MKRLFTLILSFAFLCTSVFAADVQSEPTEVPNLFSFETSELSLFIDESKADTLSERMLEAKDEYSSALRNLTQYTDNVLQTMGYSNETITLVGKFRTNSNYTPQISELAEAAPTMTFYCSDFVASTSGNRTDVTLNWTFKWSSRPQLARVDAVGAVWNQNGMVCNSALYSITFSDGTTYNQNDDLYNMDIAIDNSEKEIVMSFPMSLDSSANAWCKSGSGEFNLHLNERVTSTQVAWGYGHQTVSNVSSITLSYKGGSIGFGQDYETLCQGVRTYYPN